MTQRSKTGLKKFFKVGKVPNQSNYEDLIDSQLNLAHPTSQTITSDVTASSNVQIAGNLATTDITGRHITTTGNTTAGDATTDSHTFVGNVSISGSLVEIIGNSLSISSSLGRAHITSSGNISSSGTIIANTFKQGNPATGVIITGNITASNNISASGKIITNEIETGYERVGITLDGNITSSGDISLAGGNVILSDGIGSYKGIFTGTTTSDTLIAKLPSVNNVAVGNNAKSTILYGSATENDYGHGTGFSVILGNSVNVHTVAAGDFKISGKLVHPTSMTSSCNIFVSGAYGGNDFVHINNTGHITASNNISSSGQFYGNILNAKTRVKAIDSTLEFSGDTLDFVDASSTSRLFKGTVNGAFEAYHAGAKKFETISNGVNITGNVTGSGNLKIDGSQVDFTGLPTSDPGVEGRLYNDEGTVKISLGS